LKGYWWTGHRNFGDLLTPILLRELAHIELDWARAVDADMIGAGSIATHIPKGWGGIVWGTGKPRKTDNIDLSQANVLALRGSLTAEGSGAKRGYVLGDPGLLVSLLPDIEVNETIPLGVVAHWEDRMLKTRWKGELIDVEGDPMEVIRQIARCRRVVSSSLHGIIVADAFGKERRWERSSKQPMFKFADHGTVVGRFEPAKWGYARNVNQAQTGLIAALGRLRDLLEDRWSGVDNRWSDRLELVASHVPNGAKVLDLGAGKQGLKELLPSCTYTPADLPDFDMNANRFPQGRWDVVVAAGVLEYADRPQEVLKAVRRLAPTTLLTYQTMSGKVTRGRARSGFHNHLSRTSLERMIRKAGFRPEKVGVWENQDIYRLTA